MGIHMKNDLLQQNVRTYTTLKMTKVEDGDDIWEEEGSRNQSILKFQARFPASFIQRYIWQVWK